MFYTRKGDTGYTDLLGDRVPKYHARPETYGTIDEATSFLGLARAMATTDRTREIILQVQRDLYLMMAELAFASNMDQHKFEMNHEHVLWVEQQTDSLSDEVELPPHFIIPGDTVPGAALDSARGVIRRAERLAVHLFHEEEIRNEELIAYLNRLSSLLFILARFEDHAAGITPTKAKQS
ncbi:MAG: cob(I)yrinic acid a,c-diamide adenosyltransferase [Sphaerobacteraceae bacterium]|nr:MAG: cob(I)yrinic acid a,c-diamide adenosyltransferase [Sphaerobacteraceae bacterium]